MRLVGFVSAISILTPLAAPAFGQACADPTPADSTWWRLTRHPQADGSFIVTVPEPPPIESGIATDRLAGAYRLVMVHTVGPDRGDSIVGRLEMGASGGGSVFAPEGWPSYLTFAPESSAEPNTREVFVMNDGSLTLVIGNPGLAWTDSGVLLEVFTAAEALLSGRWVDGGLSVFGGSGGAHPQGWFCLSRE